MSGQMRQLAIRAAELQGESDLLRLRLGDQARDLGRMLDSARRAIGLGLLAWRMLAALWERHRGKDEG